MIHNIKKVVQKEDRARVFNKKGRLVEITGKELEAFNKYGGMKEFPRDINEEEKQALELLCDLELVEYEDYTPKEIRKKYSNQLYHVDSEEPLQEAPFLAHLAITTKCNMRCTYCSVREAHQNVEELTTQQWKDIIKKLSESGVFQIGFTGGEPTLRKDVNELMRYTEEIGCVCNLTTNGWQLDEEFTKEMAETGIQQCQISLDSFDEEIHDRLRGNGSLGRVVNAIKLLQKHNIHVGIDCVVSKNNIKDIGNMIKKCEEMKIEYVTLIKLKKGSLDEKTFKELVPSYEEYGQVIEKLCYRKNKNPNVTIDCASISNLQHTLKDEEMKKIPTAGCPIGHNLICIAPNGDIYPCAALMEEQFKLGNIITDDFKKIWKENQILRNFRNIKNKVEGKCKTCNRLDFCRGGCRGIAQTINKSLYASDGSCEFIRR